MHKLKETTLKFPMTQIWNDSCSCKELAYAMENKAVGATTNPVIVLNVLKNEMPAFEAELMQQIKDNPDFNEDEIAWIMIKHMAMQAGKLLLNEFEATSGKRGRISLQTNAKNYRSKDKMISQGLDLAKVIANSQIKAPTSKAGVEAFEELTYLGVSINATVSFSVAQAIGVAQAVERGLERRLSEGLSIDTMNPVCTIMAGRVDDYLKSVVASSNIIIDPECLEWGGVAIVKKAYSIYQARNYRTKLLVAAFRNHYHWSEFIGGDIILTIPYDWQVKYNNCDVDIISRIDTPVDQKHLEQLLLLEDFKKGFLEDGLKLEEFETYGPFIKTMNQFLEGYDNLIKLIRPYFFKNK